MKKSSLKLSPLVLGILTATTGFANTTQPSTVPSVQLSKTVVIAKRNKAANTESLGRDELDNNMVRDVRDLVRYSTDVGIADNGRHLKGFAMRGVEGNRVGISIDGVNLPDSEENTLYARYGNFNPSRLSIDTELVRNISLEKGANSFNSGSGSLGGTVQYRTLDAGDILTGDDTLGGIVRTGYASKNREWTHTIGTAYQNDNFEALALYSQRQGHELKSRGKGNLTLGSESQRPDPATHKNRSYLAKLAWQITPNHRIGASINGQNGKNYTDERSYMLLSSMWREADDRQKRTNSNLFYEYSPPSDWLAKLRVDYDKQKTDLSAINYKGTHPYDWRTNTQSAEKNLDEIFDRRMQTDFDRLSLRADFQPFGSTIGEHTLSAKAYVARRDFKNINNDRGGVGTNYAYQNTYTIQYPMRTEQLGISIKDSVRLTERLSAAAGLRYDQETIKPQELNAACSQACTSEGKPDGKTFKVASGFAGVNWQFSPAWKTGYQISTGYRVPTASEMYFTFKNPYGTWKSNPELKPEKSLSHSLSLQGYNNKGLLDLGLYTSSYRDFLSEQTSLIVQQEYGRTYQTPMNQTVNIDKARISGLELQTKLNLDQIFPVAKGWKFYGSLGYSRGKLSTGNSLLSIQPIKGIVGIDYEAPTGKWGVFSRLSYLGAKKANDAKVEDIKSRCLAYEFDWWTGENVCNRTELYKETITAPYLNKSAQVFDIFGFYKPTERATVRAGVYNVFDRKYHTWDALRGINSYGTTNTVDRQGKGLERFYAPGRNFAVSLEYKF
ncbi:hemoglobin/transferrin/lactoferrin receptor protein [Moraxella cuniculi DSM 21768]|uniref:Hemoglobin/transferrin/lactoferrin receptor protein n=1 Tax=Moraxella cuniculi DSM 21768 TaxID=1122245 RepID=A0A1N7F129_9GAMM|nr:TonB-dependent hemoglobin/transferrin/lactoferrin family receptor [Moraxella cuniculi]OOS05074.1 ligand-gated channel protein [Moraxella cuniculi]SIR93984.1 hemoglobin/transferrin/lactoferrin receptor protein [Moraxella cuniculi DSM 21768]